MIILVSRHPSLNVFCFDLPTFDFTTGFFLSVPFLRTSFNKKKTENAKGSNECYSSTMNIFLF